MEHYTNYNDTNQYTAPPNYQPPYPPYYDPTTEVMSVGQYIGMFILSAIPLVNVICWIVWLCSPHTNRNKKNYIKANIILWVLGVVLTVFAVILAYSTGIALFTI